MSDKTNDFGLTRRKMLFGLGTVGLAAGGMGAGTWAGYVDNERKHVTTHAGSLDLKISDDGQSNWRNGPIQVDLPELHPGDCVEDCEYLKNFGQTDGMCLTFSIPKDSVVTDEGQSIYSDPDEYNPEPETDTDTNNGGELDDQLLIKGYVEDENGHQVGICDYVPFNDLVDGQVPVPIPFALEKNGGNMVKMCFALLFEDREDNNDAMKDTLSFDIDITLKQTCEIGDSDQGTEHDGDDDDDDDDDDDHHDGNHNGSGGNNGNHNGGNNNGNDGNNGNGGNNGNHNGH